MVLSINSTTWAKAKTPAVQRRPGLGIVVVVIFLENYSTGYPAAAAVSCGIHRGSWQTNPWDAGDGENEPRAATSTTPPRPGWIGGGLKRAVLLS
jgi:hypothetical protein